MEKKVLQLHAGVYEPIADLATWRAMPTGSIRHLDPFLFLNHHGPQEYSPGNKGLPFGPHPHRGFETLTFVLQGDITHKDSVTGESVITAGGIQWMTAGKGLIHAEISSDQFKKEGGMEEVIQLWLNLTAKLKRVDPQYTGLQKEDIPELSLDQGKAKLNLVSGTYGDHEGPIDSMTDLFTSTLVMEAGGRFQDRLPAGRQVLLYVIRGKVKVNGTEAQTHQLVELSLEGEIVDIEALGESHLIYCYGTPFNEPIVAHGPFVMNSEEEIYEAIRDYQSGKLGSLSL